MEPAEETVLRIARGYQLSQALYVAAKLGIADILGSEPLGAEAVAQAVDVRAPPLRRVLRALVAAGVFTELDDGRFATNDAAAALRADAPGRCGRCSRAPGAERRHRRLRAPDPTSSRPIRA